jgi:hypothetical protein
MLEDPKLAAADILSSVGTSLGDASSPETIPSGTEDQGQGIESSAPLDYEVRLLL